MKIKVFHISVLMISSFFLNSQSSARVLISTPDEDLPFVQIMRSIDGLLWFTNQDTIHRGTNGMFQGELTISTLEHVLILAGDKRVRMILQPNQSYELEIKEKSILFKKDNAEGLDLLNNKSLGMNRRIRFGNTLPEVIDNISNLKDSDMEKLDSLRESKSIDSVFYNYFKKDIDYKYALNESNATVRLLNRPELNRSELLNHFNEIYESYPIEVEPIPSSWSRYVGALNRKIIYEEINIGSLKNSDSIERNIHLSLTTMMLQKVSIDFHERYLANYIFGEAIKKDFDKSLIPIFEDFKVRFPQSPYISLLNERIDNIKDYHEKKNMELSEKVKLIPKNKAEKFKELIEELKGEKLYVDLWGSWCVSCLKEFAHNPQVDKILDEYGFKRLYVAFDKPEDEAKWMNLIKKYDLDGLHYFAELKSEFRSDFTENYSLRYQALILPQYMLIDENGTIITNEAPKPSKARELEDYLRKM